MLRMFSTVVCTLLLCGGCGHKRHSLALKELNEVRNTNTLATGATDIEKAEAEAIVEVLRQTTILPRMKRDFDVVFFQGAAANAISIVQEQLRDQLPPSRTNSRSLDTVQWLEVGTKKRPLLIRSEMVSSNQETVVWKVITQTNPGTGFICGVELKKTNTRWQAINCKIAIAD